MTLLNALTKIVASFKNFHVKEVNEMKKIAIVLVVMFGVALCASQAFAYTTPDKSTSVSATASVGAVTSLSATPGSVSFSDTAADSFASSKVTLTYKSNYNPWKLAIYTNNTGIKTFANGGPYQKSGLTDGTNLVPLKWVAKNPSSSAPSISTIGSYNFIKDKNDEDDPSTTSDDSWAGAVSSSATYAAIAYGTASSGTCIDPTAVSNSYNGDSVSGTIDVYVAALFGTYPAPVGSYSTTIGFDLYHE
ncbi:MAG: hypothetical protein WCY36_02445 [Candidatus Omnitrophota bacterium]